MWQMASVDLSSPNLKTSSSTLVGVFMGVCKWKIVSLLFTSLGESEFGLKMGKQK